MTDIPSATAGEPLTNRAVNFKASVDGLNYELVFLQKTIRVGQPATVRLRITSADGKGFTQLEPLMASFAHVVGFNQDYKTVMHMHPKRSPNLGSDCARRTRAGVSDLSVAAWLRSSFRSSADCRPFTLRSLRPPDRAMNSASIDLLVESAVCRNNNRWQWVTIGLSLTRIRGERSIDRGRRDSYRTMTK
jgi:hypothetical protein